LFATTDLGLLKSENLGENWLLIDVPANTAVITLYPAPLADGRLMLKTPAGLYASTDFGDHWTEVKFPLRPAEINDVALPAEQHGSIWVATRVGLYRSSDDGNNWSLERKGLPASTVTTVAYSAAQHAAYAVEYGNIYQLGDGAASWSMLSTALPSLRIRQLWIPDASSIRLYGITSDLGILFRN
jgi:photosystem II stability/assembly factor-like uncharacterized protein